MNSAQFVFDDPQARPALNLRRASLRITAVTAGLTMVALSSTGVANAERGAPAAPNTDDVGVPGPPHSSEVLDIAHRGASGYAPENTLAAIEEAAQRGASTVETDVQRTADGELIFMHDADLTRTTDAADVYPDRDSYDVADFTLDEIRELDAGSWFSEEFAGEPVPTLQEGLDLMRELKLGFLLEIKLSHRYPGIDEDIAEVLYDNPWFLSPGALPGRPGYDRLAIQDFNWDTVQSSRELYPDHVPHGLLGVVPEDELQAYGAWADQVNPNHSLIDADYVAAVQDAGMEVHVYTVNDPTDMRRAIDRGVDGVITDYVDVLHGVIAENQT
ncbi:glycerophosphodiester phosphodiesterase family protein [Lipingzhangella sp. LS1_29]|uniref:Glycerophosphodiester phosphodiesterase family protein n=1 Tax=Lipingzhangella rawalii TaxID=2055835 RepID=A0ABU2H6P9_9ACTN|nr:glycerophosphodiester phosphodiesterase family protein [Lipingzhangella rawalii]MDS1270976.1 glycerophosphodiester phosphodiesterase family protein [Lipingzhangella rawalii]